MDPANYKGAMPSTGNDQRLMNITFTYIKKTVQKFLHNSTGYTIAVYIKCIPCDYHKVKLQPTK